MSFLLLETGDKILLENGVDKLLLDSYPVGNTVIGLYDILGLVNNTVVGLYDINGLVSNTVIGKYDVTGVVSNTLTGCYEINEAASSIIRKYTKSVQLLQNNVEVTIVEKTDGPYNYSLWVFLDQLQTGDVVEFREYVWNPQTNSYKLNQSPKIKKNDLKGFSNQTTDDKPAMFFPPVQADRYKVTIKQTAGTPRLFDWVMYKQ